MAAVDQAVAIVESDADAAFRTELRSWLSEHGVRKGSGAAPDVYEWQKKLAAGRWAAPSWPSKFGGRDATPEQMRILGEEMSSYENPGGPFAISIGFVGPTIIAHGTPEQHARYLPKILSGEEVWCQLFSEPGAGSDLAGLTTKAEQHGDEWVVNGQKVWTSFAQGAHFGILLARTDFDVRKHRGITYFLIPMDQPGVEVRPLRQITGDASFNEVFMTDARVPKENVLGEVNGGWGVAMTTFLHERSFIGGGAGGAGGGETIVDLARSRGLASDPVARQAIADWWIHTRILKLHGDRVSALAKSGRGGATEGGIMKLAHALNLKRTGELALRLQGAAGALAGADAPSGGRWQGSFLSAPSIRIAGGTDEVQRNIIGERFLGLPSEPRLDKELPFRELAQNASTRRP